MDGQKTTETNYQAWLRRMLRLSGEELIRRSESMTFEGWDLVSDVSIEITIPHYSEHSLPEMKFRAKLMPKLVCDDVIENGFARDDN